MKFTERDLTYAKLATVKLVCFVLCASVAFAVVADGAHARRRYYHRARGHYDPPGSSMAIDLYSGRILHSKNANELRYPASLTKVMTLYLLFDALRDGKISMNTEMKVSAHAAAQSPSKLDLEPGDTIKVSDAIGALVTKSANDVAVVVAEALAPSEEEFARRMTQKARTIGMLNTTFRNASGLPNPEQHTTAQDLIILAKSVLADHPERAKVFSTRYFEYRGETFRNHNSLLFSYQGMEGMKTGFTNASGFNLIATARRGDKRLLAVVLGGSSSGSRNATMRNILNNCWEKAMTQVAARKAGVQVAHLPAKPQPATPKAAPAAKAEQSLKPEQAAQPAKALAAQVRTPRSIAAALASNPLLLFRKKPDKVSGGFLLSALETGLALPAGGRAQMAASDMSTDEPEEKGEKVSGGAARVADANPQPVGPVKNETLVAPAFPSQAANMSVHYKTVRGRVAPPPEDAEPSLAAAAIVDDPGPAPQQDQPPKVVLAAAAKDEPAEPQPQTLASATAALSKAMDQPGPYHVQVGAFPDQAQAEQRLASVKEILGSPMLKAHPQFVMPVVLPSGVTMYRARLARFSDEAQAKSSCKTLKRRSIECMIVKAP